MKRLKKIIALSTFLTASALHPNPVPSQTAENKPSIQEIDLSRRILNTTSDPTFIELFKRQLEIASQTKIGASILENVPKDVKYIIVEKPENIEDAAFWDGENCTIYDDTLISPTCGPSTLIVHEALHAIQHSKYAQEYSLMPTEQRIIFEKINETETRLNDVLMKEELYNKKVSGSELYEFRSDDWMDYRRLREKIGKENPRLSKKQIEKMTRTQFVIDTWQGNYKKDTYSPINSFRSFRGWLSTYNAKSLQLSNRRCLLARPVPDLTVDESKVARHHEIMQEYIQRMDIDVPADFFDTLNQDKSLIVIRDPKILASFGKYFDKKLKLMVMPRDDFVKIGGIVVCQDNSTCMFSPEKRDIFKKEITGKQTILTKGKQHQ